MARISLFLSCIAAICVGASADIIRPCKLDDKKCIGHNLAANSDCDTNVSGGIPHEFFVPKYGYDTPYFNSSYIEDDLLITNLDSCYVSDFYVDKEKDQAVLCIDCKDTVFKCDRTLLQHYSCCPDTEYQYKYHGSYPFYRITFYFKPASKLNPCKTQPFTYLGALPVMQIDPKDQRTSDFLTQDLTLLNIYEIENFYTRGAAIGRLFINENLCNFGCNYEYPGDN